MARKLKKDFDKDKMYHKIMPSVPPAPEWSASKPEEPEPREARPHNYMEDMVLEKLDHTMNVLGACGCGRCRKDIVALALNQLPTAYAVADGNGEKHIKKLKGTYEIKVTAAIIKAVQQVKLNPRH